jgi:hypothetical protein
MKLPKPAGEFSLRRRNLKCTPAPQPRVPEQPYRQPNQRAPEHQSHATPDQLILGSPLSPDCFPVSARDPHHVRPWCYQTAPPSFRKRSL